MEIFPPRSLPEKNRINTTLRRLEGTSGILQNEKIVDILEHHVGDNHVFVTSLISHWCGLGFRMQGKMKTDYLYTVD